VCILQFQHVRQTTTQYVITLYTLYRVEEYEPFWSTDGCAVQKSSPEQTVCICTHLTHFAVLSESTQSITQVTAHIQFIINLQ